MIQTPSQAEALEALEFIQQNSAAISPIYSLRLTECEQVVIAFIEAHPDQREGLRPGGEGVVEALEALEAIQQNRVRMSSSTAFNERTHELFDIVRAALSSVRNGSLPGALPGSGEAAGTRPASIDVETLCQVIVDIANELDCEPDNEEILQAISRLKEGAEAPWPQWADDIRKKLMEYGYDAGPEGEWNIGECMESWIDGCMEEATATRPEDYVARNILMLCGKKAWRDSEQTKAIVDLCSRLGVTLSPFREAPSPPILSVAGGPVAWRYKSPPMGNRYFFTENDPAASENISDVQPLYASPIPNIGELGSSQPMKMHIDSERLKAQIAADADVEVEAGNFMPSPDLGSDGTKPTGRAAAETPPQYGFDHVEGRFWKWWMHGRSKEHGPAAAFHAGYAAALADAGPVPCAPLAGQ